MDEQVQIESIIKGNNALEFEEQNETSSYIKVLGVGGAGTNAVNHMFKQGINGVDLFVCNTDATNLHASPVKNKISIGKLGAGNDPKVGRAAAEENRDKIKAVLDSNTRMLFITAGMGGGTGTGASPVVAEIAKSIDLPEEDEKLLVVGVVTLPFSFEGRKRKKQAEEGIERLKEFVDCIIIVNTDKLRDRKDLPISDAFALADDVLFTAVKGISEIITNVGYIQVDFRDIQSVMKNSGVALMGMGVASGENRALEAVKAATTSDLLNDNDISQTKNILLTFTCSKTNEITMDEIDTITEYIADQTNDDVDVIWGISHDEKMEDRLSITLIATGFEKKGIYTPVTRVSGPKEIIQSPSGVNNQTLEQPINNPGSLTDITITTKAPVNETPIAETPKKENEKTIITVDHNMNPIGDSVSNTIGTQTAVAEPKVVIAEPKIIVAEPKPAPMEPVFRQDTFDQPSLKSQVEASLPKPDMLTRQNADKDFLLRMEKIKKLNDMMKTAEGLEQIINTHPDVGNNYDLTHSFSAPKQQSSFSFTKEGTLGIVSNSAIDAQVD